MVFGPHDERCDPNIGFLNFPGVPKLGSSSEVRVCVAYKVPLIAIWLKTQARFKIFCVAAFIRDRQLRAERISFVLRLSGPLL